MQEIFRETKSKITLKKSRNPNFPSHVHDDIELVYTKHGSGMVYCDGQKYTLADGAWFLVFPNQIHHYTDCTDGEYFLLIMKPFDLLRYGQNFMKGVPDSAVRFFEPGQDDGLGYLLETACREYGRDGYSDVIAAYLTALFGKLLPFFSGGKSYFPAGHSAENPTILYRP